MCLESTIPHAWLFPQGKEFETRLKEKKPGDLSDELRISLGMPVGPVSASYPTGKEEKGLLIEVGGRQRDMVGQMISCVLSPAECPQGSSPVADRHAATWTTPVIPQPENPWAELAYPRELFLWLPCWWLGQTPSG